jgi:hypothetical protein
MRPKYLLCGIGVFFGPVDPFFHLVRIFFGVFVASACALPSLWENNAHSLKNVASYQQASSRFLAI